MKNLFTIICFMSITVASQAQSAKFNDAMTKALAEMDTLKTGDQFMAMSNKFERIALAEKINGCHIIMQPYQELLLPTYITNPLKMM